MPTKSTRPVASALPKKTCTKCKKKKLASPKFFGPDARGLLGMRGDCRVCRRAADKTNKRSRRLRRFAQIDSVESVLQADSVKSIAEMVDREFMGRASKVELVEEAGPLQEIRLLPGSTTEKVLLIPDCHHPYHDKAAWYLMLEAAKAIKPDMIVILGDFADFYSVSSHSKNPNRVRDLKVEVEAVNVALDELDTLGAKRKVFVSGNHCDRLERYLSDRAPELFNMVKIRDLFRLTERGWYFVPYKRHAKIGRLHVTHDTNRAGRYAHYQSQADFGGANVVIGHTHRLGYMVEGSAQGEPHVSAMFGWLGDFDQVDYMHQVRARRDWSHGFGVGYLQPDGCVHLTPIPIINRTVVVEGKTIRLG